MKMRKMLSILLALAMVIGCLAACGKKAEETPAPAPEKQTEQQTETKEETPAPEPAAEETPAPAAEDTTPGSTPRNETLYFNGQQWGAINAWNPIHSNANNFGISQNSSAREILYETLFMYNLLDGKLYPLLGTDYAWNDDKSELTVHLNQAAHWDDGTPVTAADVVGTYEFNHEYSPSFPGGWDPYITGVEAKDDYTVVIKMAQTNGVTNNPLQGLQYIAQQYVMCKAYLDKVVERNGGDQPKVQDDLMEDFVASGPYKRYYNDDQKVIFVRDDNYWGADASMWGSLPVPKYLGHNLFADNAAGNLAFSNGEVDVSQQFNIDIPQMMETNPNISAFIDEAPYNMCVTMPTAWLKLDVPGLDQKAVRQAIAYAVDYDQIVSAAMGGQCPTFSAVPRSVMNPTDGEQALIDKEALKPYQFAGNDIDRANKVLDDAGILDTDGDGYRELNGTKIHLQAACPTGWSDWEASMEIVAAAGKKIGIEIETYYPEASTYMSDMLTTGQFEICMWSPSGASPTCPWGRVRALMSSEFAGITSNNWSGNFGWFRNDRADELIQAIPTMEDSQLKAAYTELSQIYLDEVPSFSLMYRPELFHNTNESVWSGFPALGDGDNIPPTDCTDGYGIAALYNLYLVQ